MTAWQTWQKADPRPTASSPATERVATDCLYPGGRHVVVAVRHVGESCAVSDDGAGWDTLKQAGFEPTRTPAYRAARVLADQMGVPFKRGVYVIDGVGPEQLRSAVVHVANASQAWVRQVMSSGSSSGKLSLTSRAVQKLGGLLGPSLQRNRRVQGFSSRPHQLAFLLPLDGDRNALIEPVATRLDSIAATYLKFSDVGRAYPDWPREALVEHIDDWPSADLALLAEVATGISDLDGNLSVLAQRIRA